MSSPYGTGLIPDHFSPDDPIVDMDTMRHNAPSALPGGFSIFKDQVNGNGPVYTKSIYAQGSLGTCTCNAVAAAYLYELQRQGRDIHFSPSRCFLYYVTRLARVKGVDILGDKSPDFYRDVLNDAITGTVPTEAILKDYGTMAREVIRVFSIVGTPEESTRNQYGKIPGIWPYDPDAVPQTDDPNGPIDPLKHDPDGFFAESDFVSRPPDAQCYIEAQQHVNVAYAKPHLDEECWKLCIQKGFPIVFGFSMYQSFSGFSRPEGFKNVNGIAPVPNPKVEGNAGGHCVLCVGWNDKVRAADGSEVGCFLVQNSWGEGWGDGGLFWMPYEWLKIKDEKLNRDVIHSQWTLMDPTGM